MKSHYFISGLPRSGSTLLSAILKQNPDIYADISSPVNCIVNSTINAITISESNSLLDIDKRKNILHGIFDGYYKHIEKPVIFDTNRKWSSKTNLLKELFPNTKIICPVRDIVSIINSFEVISLKNSFHSKTLTKKSENVFIRCDEMMDKLQGVVMVPWISLKEGYAANPQMIMFVEYENLCKNPKETISKVYDFIEKPYFNHDFDNVEYSNETFDKACNLIDLHKVKRKVEYNPPKMVIPQEIIQKYKSMKLEFWKENYSCDPLIIDKLEEKFIVDYN